MQRRFQRIKESLRQRFFTPHAAIPDDELPHERHLEKYVSHHELHPGQTRYSRLNMAKKIDKAITRGDAVWNENKQKWEHKHHHGKSILPFHKALPVIHTSFGYLLVDGHHDVLTSIHLQAEMIPIRIIADLRHYKHEHLWEEAEKNGWVYLYTIDGEKKRPPKHFKELADDANRYFAAVTARKYLFKETGDYTSSGAEYPLWVKIDKDIPFIEFMISNALFKNGFIYNPEQMGNPPREEVVEEARRILLAENIPGLRVIANRTHYQQINVKQDDTSLQSEEYPDDHVSSFRLI